MTSSSITVTENRDKALIAGQEGRALRRMWIRLIFFLLPVFLLLGPLIYEVDPYALFRHRSVIPEITRAKYGHRVNEVLWKMIEYDRHPMPNIMLGDSQMGTLPAAAVSSITGEPYANIAYTGGTLRESIDTFWYTSRKSRLRRVYFGLSFMAYTAKLEDRVPQAEEILRNPLAYFMNSDVVEASAYDIADSVFHRQTDFGPKMSKEAFWRNEIQYLASRYQRDADPGLLRNELKKIISYCHSQNIWFAFLIAPQSMDAQRQVELLGVEKQYRHFEEDLNGMAPVYDCDVENSLTSDRSNFGDPFHMEPFAAEKLVADLWSGQSSLCRSPGSHQETH